MFVSKVGGGASERQSRTWRKEKRKVIHFPGDEHNDEKRI
jgi:hypothetical protein